MSNLAFNLLLRARQLREQRQLVVNRAGMIGVKYDQLWLEALELKCRELASRIISGE